MKVGKRRLEVGDDELCKGLKVIQLPHMKGGGKDEDSVFLAQIWRTFPVYGSAEFEQNSFIICLAI